MNINTGMSSLSNVQRPPPPPPTGQGVTDKLDADKGGGLSATEIEDTRLSKMIGDRFGEVDVDGDGALSVAELDTELKANGPPEGGRPPPPPGEGRGPPDIGGPSSELNTEALYVSLFSTDETEADTEQLATAAQTLYSEMQSIFEDTSIA